MDIKTQISGCNNPQEFTRLCNILLQAEFGVNYQTVDDDRSDGGNDGYIRDEKRLFARHCFKKIPKRSLDSEILKKISSDLKKVPQLRKDGVEISKWTFLSPYPISNAVVLKLREFERIYHLEVSQLGPDYLAGLVLKYPYLVSDFPWIEIHTLARDVNDILNILLRTVKEKKTKLSEEAEKELDLAIKYSEVSTSENRTKLKTLFYSSTNLVVRLQCAMSLLNTSDILDDSLDDLLHYCDVGISAARKLNKIGEEAVLLAEKGSWISYEFAKLDMETAFQIRMGNTVGISLMTEPDKQRILDRLNLLKKEFSAIFNEAMEKAKLSGEIDFLAMVFLSIGQAAGNRFFHLNALGAEQAAAAEKTLCKTAIENAKNLYASSGDELGYAYALSNLANTLRFFDEKEVAVDLCKKVLSIAEKHKDLRLLKNTQKIISGIETNRIPDYVHGERD